MYRRHPIGPTRRLRRATLLLCMNGIDYARDNRRLALAPGEPCLNRMLTFHNCSGEKLYGALDRLNRAIEDNRELEAGGVEALYEFTDIIADAVI